MRSQWHGFQLSHSKNELTFELNQTPRTHTEIFTSTLMLVHPTIITYIDDGGLENLAIYKSFPLLLSELTEKFQPVDLVMGE